MSADRHRDDGGAVHTEPMTPDPISSAVAALVRHDATCPYCATALPGSAACAERLELKTAWRRAVREAASGQITTDPASR